MSWQVPQHPGHTFSKLLTRHFKSLKGKKRGLSKSRNVCLQLAHPQSQHAWMVMSAYGHANTAHLLKLEELVWGGVSPNKSDNTVANGVPCTCSQDKMVERYLRTQLLQGCHSIHLREARHRTCASSSCVRTPHQWACPWPLSSRWPSHFATSAPLSAMTSPVQ